LGNIAERTGCAIVVIGHLNKGSNKSQYRGLGSIDVQAAARSVLTLGRVRDEPYLRAFAHGKSNLAPEGKSIAFELNPDPSIGFRWIGEYPITIDELLGYENTRESASLRATNFLKKELMGKTISANDILNLARENGISERTLKRAKEEAGVRSIKQSDHWNWTIDGEVSQGSQAFHI
jgi:hypothetical protein